MYDSIYVASGRGKPVRTESRFVAARGWAGVDVGGEPRNSWGGGVFGILIVVVATGLYAFVKTQRTVP